MSLDEMTQRVALHYKENSPYQLTRLDNESPVEYAITLRKLDQWIKSGSKIADVGTGAGHYALQLAHRNCHVHLIDIAENLLDACRNKFHEAKLEQYVLGITTASATNLSFILPGSMDAVILLGPLYHLNTKSERQAVLQEAYRILAKGGIIFAGGINRLAVLRELWNVDRFDSIKAKSPSINHIKKDILDFINTGISNANVFPPLSDAFFATSNQFREECSEYFKELEFSGVESFSGHTQNQFFKKDDNLKSDWLDLVEITGRTNEGIASSEHFLFIGKK